MMSQYLPQPLSPAWTRWLPCLLLGPLAAAWPPGSAWSAAPAWSWGPTATAATVTFDVPQTVAATPVACAASAAGDPLPPSDPRSNDSCPDEWRADDSVDTSGGLNTSGALAGGVPLGDDYSGDDYSGDDYRLVQLDLTLSILVDGLSAASIDQLVIDVRPQGGRATVVDYAPRTELASGYSGGIEVVQSEEQNRLLTLSLQSQYPGVGSGGLTGTNGDKNTESLTYQRVAPLHVVAASGTRQRGRAVYFKFRATEQQILEGERPLSLTLRVPADWRSEMIEVAVVADSLPNGLSSSVAAWTGWEPSPQRLAAARFLVAAYRADCAEARAVTAQLAIAETQMRRHLQPLIDAADNRSANNRSAVSAGGLATPVSRGWDWSRGWNRSRHQQLAEAASLSLHRALAGTLQPQDDRGFGRLPDETRAAVGQYLQARRRFVQLSPQLAEPDQTVQAADYHSSLTAAGT